MKRVLFFLSFIFLALSVVFSFEDIVVFGDDDNWGSLISYNNLTFKSGRGGYTDIELKDGEYTVDSSTDLLLHFNSSRIM